MLTVQALVVIIGLGIKCKVCWYHICTVLILHVLYPIILSKCSELILLVSDLVYSELEIFQFISVGYSHVHVMWFHHFYMNQSVQFSFSKTVVLNSPTHTAIHRNKKKWKLNHNNFLLFLYPFLSSLIRKGSLTSCEEELREVQWFQVDFDITNNHHQKCWEGYYFIPFFLLLSSWPTVEQNSVYNNNYYLLVSKHWIGEGY